jgi:hypothetical protein
MRGGRQRIARIVESIEQGFDLGPHLRFVGAVGRTTSYPSQRLPGRTHALEVGENVHARGDDRGLAKSEELGPRALVEGHAHGVHRLQRSGKASAALASATRHSCHLAELFGKQRDDRIGFAVRYDPYDESS